MLEIEFMNNGLRKGLRRDCKWNLKGEGGRNRMRWLFKGLGRLRGVYHLTVK